jgi:hypothetical protein
MRPLTRGHETRKTGLALAPLIALILGGLMLPKPALSEGTMKNALPLKSVTLFSSGVGFYQRAGEIDGAASFDLTFRTDQINDLLKSLTLYDPDGQVQPVTYASSDPSSRGWLGLGLKLNGSDSMGTLLRQLQGAKAHIETFGNESIDGSILSVSTVPRPSKDVVVQEDALNLLTDSGLTTIFLSDIKRIKLQDETLDKKLRDALTLIASGLDRDEKSVTVNFGGSKKREVSLGYLLESPVWKTSYRLVLNDGKPNYLQGWAVVENMTDEDWNSVMLSLISGRPVSFVQDLYTPLYISRPTVEPQVIGSPMPQLYGATLEDKDAAIALESGNVPQPLGAMGYGAMMKAAPMARRAVSDSANRDRSLLRESVEDLAKSVSAQAQGEERGELFEYAIDQPITIPSHHAAMVPILATNVAGKKVSIYTPQVNSEHPMNAVRLKNDTGLHLAGGPITVYDGGIYAGDAQIETLQPNEDRLLSYAVDLAVEGKYETSSQPEELISVRADSGVLRISRKLRKDDTYTLRNKDDKPRSVVIEQPIEADWTLVKPSKPDEATATNYRFYVEVPAGKTGKLTVTSERTLTDSVSLTDADLNFLTNYAQNGKVSEKVRAALKTLIEKRQLITDLQSQITATSQEIDSINSDQARIRENMKELDRQSALYQQYVKKLTDQETRIEALREKVKSLQASLNAAQDDLKKYIDSLNLE